MTLNVARGALTINADLTSDGLMQLLANRGMTFAAGTSTAPVVATSTSDGVTLVAATLSMGAYSAINAAGTISVTTTGDATIGQLNSSLSYAAAGNAPSIIVTAGGVASLGAIIDNGDGQTKFVASGSGAELSLSASNGMGSATDRFIFSAARLSASASAGDVYLKALTDTEAGLLSAVKGSVDILGTGGLTLDQVVAGTAVGASGSFSAVTANGSIVIGAASSSISQTIHASRNVTFNALASTGNAGDFGNINVTADNGFILAQTVTLMLPKSPALPVEASALNVTFWLASIVCEPPLLAAPITMLPLAVTALKLPLAPTAVPATTWSSVRPPVQEGVDAAS